MTNLPASFAVINRRAIELMRFKLFNLAEDLLDEGIKYLEATYHESHDDCMGGCDPACLSTPTVRLETTALVPRVSTFIVGSKQDSSFAMFEKAFQIVPTGTSCYLPESDASLLLSVFHYNLGLCYRLSGLASRATMIAGDELEKSLFSYEVAYNFLQESAHHGQPSSRLLELALLNNMGHMCCLLWDTQEALFRLGQIKVLLDECLLYCHRHQHLSGADDIMVFSCNVNYNESMLAGLPPPAA
ncbi:hypothetical protein ACA910_000307 [Epithemia clementina (nom. ined.)]